MREASAQKKTTKTKQSKIAFKIDKIPEPNCHLTL